MTSTSELVSAYLSHCEARGLSSKTLDAYRWSLGYLPSPLPCLTEDIEAILLTARSHLSPESVYDIWRGFGTFYRWAEARRGVHNPMTPIKKPRTQRKLPRALSRQEVMKLVATAEARSPRDRLMVLVPLDTGLRLSEIAGLRKADLSRTVRVMGKGGKERHTPITPAIRDELETLGDSEFIWFGRRYGQDRPLALDGVKTAYRRIFRTAGIKGGVHSLRHTFATEYLRRGGDLYRLSRCLGHTTVRMTERYVHLIVDDLVAEHTIVSPALPYL